MRPEWVYDTHTSWINAEDIDLASVSKFTSFIELELNCQSMEGQNLLPFTGLTISISGVDDSQSSSQPPKG